jgi:hypothetical protein
MGCDDQRQMDTKGLVAISPWQNESIMTVPRIPRHMKYQLVLQFQAESVQEFDELVVLENLLVETLPLQAEVDGHDFGSGEFNIFILTDLPKASMPLKKQSSTIALHRR